jgi:hypothetical protein
VGKLIVKPITSSFLSKALISIIFAFLVVSYLISSSDTTKVLYLLGINWGQQPFYDTYSPLSWLECYRDGFDVYQRNPCDTRLGLQMSYPPAWLGFSILGLDRSHTGIIALALGAAFCASCLLLPAPPSRASALCLALALCSNAVLLGLYQGNFDLVIFVGAVLAVYALHRGTVARQAAYLASIVLAALKIYPIFLLVLAARESLRCCLVLAGVVAIGTVVYVSAAPAEFQLTLGWLPRDRPLEMFGRGNAGQGLRLILGEQHIPPWAVNAVTVAFLAAAVAIAARTAALLARIGAGNILTPLERDFLAAGAALVVGCFLSGQSFRYKAMFLALAIVPLATLALRARTAPARRYFTAAPPLIVFLLWSVFATSVAKHTDTALGLSDIGGMGLLRSIAWIAGEAAWLWIIGVLGGCLAWQVSTQRAPLEFHRVMLPRHRAAGTLGGLVPAARQPQPAPIPSRASALPRAEGRCAATCRARNPQ